MEISLENFASLVAAGHGNHDLESTLLRIVADGGQPNDELFRKLLNSDDMGDAHVVLASANGSSRTSIGPLALSSEPLWLDIGCVSKLITATTVHSVFGSQGEPLKTRLVDVLDADWPKWFSEITLGDLLNHTHGIDEPQGMTLPTLGDGRVDVHAVIAQMGTAPLHRPGQLYSYACVGPWLLAAVLERKLGEKFVDTVRQAFPAILPPYSKEDVLCPALGGMTINAVELLQALVRATTYSNDLRSRVIRLGVAWSIPYPAWHPQEFAVCSGWKAYSNGWYGHQAIQTKTPLVLRVSPADGIGFIISSRSVHPWLIIDAVCSKSLVPSPRPPKGFSTAGGTNLTLSSLLGAYQRVDSRVQIFADSSGIRMEVTSTSPKVGDQDAVRNFMMRPIGPETFWVSSAAEDGANSFFEFIRDAAGDVTHLWNGGLVWRKIT